MNERRAAISCHCPHCPNCCRTVRVPVTHFDLLRLSEASGQSASTLSEWLAPEAVDMSGEPESFVELDAGRRLLVLKHEAGGCLLLLQDGLCGVYPARPAACAAYPYALSDNSAAGEARQLFVLDDAPCASAVFEADGTESRLAVQQVESELGAFVALVAQWNRRQKRRRLAGHRSRGAADFFEALGMK